MIPHKKDCSTQPEHKPGQSLVEIALVLPALVILFLGIVEISFFLFSHVQVANATRAGARYGSLCRLHNNCANLSAEVSTSVYAEAQFLKMTGANTKITVLPNPVPIPVAVGSPLTVTVTYTHTPPFISSLVPMFPSTIPIHHRVIMHFDK
jgi:Flp pilus assembly protein TadG